MEPTLGYQIRISKRIASERYEPTMTSRVVLITGASAGFGEASAEHLTRLGHRVYGTSRRAEFPDPADPFGRLEDPI